jgi:purine-binding chemotaxis protein CheW
MGDEWMTSHDHSSALMNGTTASVQDQQIVLCELGGELYGIDIARVEEIIRLPKITRVPRAPHSIEGVINLRGTVIPVVDLRQVLGLRLTEATKSSRVVVVSDQARSMRLSLNRSTL